MVTNMAAYVGSSQGSEKRRIAATQLIGRLKNCWSCDIDWDKHPRMLRGRYACLQGNDGKFIHINWPRVTPLCLEY